MSVAHADFVSPTSIFDLVNFRVSEFYGVSGSLVTRLCEGEFGVTREEWQFVAMLAALGPLSPSDLAARTVVDRSQTSRTLGALVAKGLLVRQKLADDGRRVRVSLSTRGQALYAQVLPLVVRIHQEVLEVLSPRERRTLARTLARLHARALEVSEHHRNREAGGGAKAARRLGGSRVRWRSEAF